MGGDAKDILNPLGHDTFGSPFYGVDEIKKMGGTTVEAPAPVNPAQIGSETLATQLQLAPQVFAANQEYLPKYLDLALQQLNRASPDLNALQAQANTAQRAGDIADVQNLGGAALQAWRSANPELVGAMGQLSSQINAAAGQPAPQVGDYRVASPQLGPATLASTPAVGAAAQAGLPILGAAATSRAARLGPAAQAASPTLGPATQAQLPNFGPAATAATPGLGPASTATSGLQSSLEADAQRSVGQVSPLQIELQKQAMEQLGGNLSPEELRRVQQDTRSAYAARGLYDSNQAIGAEILNTDAARRARQQQAQQLALGVDAAGQAATAQNRAYATGIAGQGLQAGQFNAGQANQFALNQYATAANLGQFNAGQANQLAAMQGQLAGQLNLANASAANQFASQQYGTQAQLGQFNAGEANQQAALQAQLRQQAGQFNAGQANQFALNQYATAANLGQFNAGQANQLAALQAQLAGQTNLANASAANQYGLTQFATAADLGQFNANLAQQRDLTNAQLGLTQQQQGIANQFNLAQLYASQAQDPYQLVLGRSGTPQFAQSVAGQAGPTMFDPFNSNITSIYAGNNANQLAAATANANNNASMQGAGLGAAAGIGAAAIIAF